MKEYSQTHLYALNGHSADISGEFYLGTGMIKTNRVYIGEVKKDGGYVQYIVPAEDTIKIEKDIDHAIFWEQLCSTQSFFMEKFLKSNPKAKECLENEPKRILEIPKGTIIKQFKL